MRAGALALAVLGASLVVQRPAPAAGDDALVAAFERRLAARAQVLASAEELRAAELASLSELSADIGGLPPLVELLKSVHPDGGSLTDSLAEPTDTAAAKRKWRSWCRKWERRWTSLLTLAEKRSRGDLAYSLAREALARFSGLSAARKITGERLWDGQWLSPFAIARVKSGEVWDDRAGWVPARDRKKLDDGLLPIDGRWRQGDAVRRARAAWATAWNFEDRCWRVRTNLPPEQWGVIRTSFADAYELFRLELGHLFQTRHEHQLQALVFAAKADIEAHVQDEHGPNSEYAGLVGFYDPKEGALHVTWNSTRPHLNSWLSAHEAMHALLGEAEVAGSKNALQKDAFVEEALAVWCEETAPSANRSLPVTEPGWPGQYKNYLQGSRRKGLRQLVAMSAYEFTDHVELYTNGSAVHRFVRQDTTARRWEAMKEYVGLLHKHQAHPDLFPKLCGTTWEQLEKEWNAFCGKLLEDPSYGKKPR